MTSKVPANPAEEWLRREASENPRSICARLLPDKIAVVTEKMHRDIPYAVEHERVAWLLRFWNDHPINFDTATPPPTKADISKMSAQDKLAVANGGTNNTIRNIPQSKPWSKN